MNFRIILSGLTLSLPFCFLFSCSDPEERAETGDQSELSGYPLIGEANPVRCRELEFRPTGQAGQPLFESLPSNQTGVDFQNLIQEDHPMRHLYATEKVCGGVAVGDLDGDGRPDLFFTNGPSANGLFLQKSAMNFVDATEASGLPGGDSWGAGAAMIDIDGDGDLDIYVANYGKPNQLYVNKGDATFEEKAAEFGLAYVSASHMPTFCDYDKDGDLDLYLLTNRYHSPKGQPKAEDVLRFEVVNGAGRIKYTDPTLGFYFRPFQSGKAPDGRPIFNIQKVGQADVLFRNDGGRFVDVSKESGIYGVGFGLSATWWDYNQDGWVDLWVGNDFDDPDRVYRNNGDGTFTDVVKDIVPHTSWFSMGADFADLNGDQKPDLICGKAYGRLEYFRNTGTKFVAVVGTLSPFDNIQKGVYSAPAFTDLDGDGDQDIIVGSYMPFYLPVDTVYIPKVGAVRSRLTFFRNTGTRQAAAFVEEYP